MQNDGTVRVRTEERGRDRIVHIDGEVCLMNAGALRTAFMDGAQSGTKTTVDASGVGAIDLSGLQLICSACKTYAARGAVLEFGERSEALRRSARSAGYDARGRACGCDSACLWAG